MSFPVVALSVLGIVFAVLGLFAPNIAVMVIGLVALAVAGLLEVLGRTRAPEGTNRAND